LKERELGTNNVVVNDNYKILQEKSKNISETVVSNTSSSITSLDQYNTMNKKLITNSETLNKLETQISTIMNQANILLINDAQQTEKLSQLEVQICDSSAKLNELESADIYLQQSQEMLSKRVDIASRSFTKYLKDISPQEGDFRKEHQSDMVPDTRPEPDEQNFQHPYLNQLNHLEEKVDNIVQRLNDDKLMKIESTFEEKLIKSHKTEVNKSEYFLKNLTDSSDSDNSGRDGIGKSEFEILKKKIEDIERERSCNLKESHLNKEILKESVLNQIEEKVCTTEISNMPENEYICRDINQLHRILDLMAVQDKATTLQLLRLEHDLFLLQENKKFYRFIEMIGGLDRSLNEMAEDFLVCKEKMQHFDERTSSIEKLYEDQMLNLKRKIEDFDRIKIQVSAKTEELVANDKKLQCVSEDLENVKKKEAKDFDEIKERTKILENMLSSRPGSVRFSDEEKLTIHVLSDDEEKESLIKNPHKHNKWLGGLFRRKNSGTLCC